MKKLILCLMIIALSGCVTKSIPHQNEKYQERLNVHKKYCTDIGFTKGTEPFGRCMLELLKLQAEY